MDKKGTSIIVVLEIALLCLGLGCRKERGKERMDATYEQLQTRYGNGVAEASSQFKSATLQNEDFYKSGGKMKQADILVPCLQAGMSRADAEALLGKPDNLRLEGEMEYWDYTLFYSQALILKFDAEGKLNDVDGYGSQEWKKQGGN